MAFAVSLSSCSKKAQQEKPRTAPVSVAKATEKDVPVEINAIGEMQAYSSVAVKSQVNGLLLKVHFTEGQYVKKGDLLFSIDPRPFEAALSQAEATLARDRAQLNNAKVDASRYEELVKKGYVAQAQYDQFRTAAEALEGTVKADESTVANAKILLGYTKIHSPLTGRTGGVQINEGNIVRADSDKELVTIYQIEPIYAAFSVPEQNLPEIKSHMAKSRLDVAVTVPEAGDGNYKGELTFVNNTVDRQTGTILLKGTLKNSDRKLWPGQFVNVALKLATERNAVTVPSQAVMAGQKGQYVFVVKNDMTAEQRPVEAGRTYGSETVVSKGVNPGETVITDGQLQVLPGIKVEIKGGAAEKSK